MIRRIISFQNLKLNWDSYGSQPIHKDTIKLALQMVMFLPPGHEWFVAPTPDGEIMFESDTAMIEVLHVGKLERR